MRIHPRLRSLVGAVLLGLCTLPACAAETSAASTRNELQRCLNQIREAQGIPGALLSTDNRNLRSGVANVETGTRIHPEDRFRIGSNTKTFVATVVLQLVAEDKLALDDKLADLLGAQVANVPYADQITVRQLLNMTSGIYDYNDAAFQAQWYGDPGKIWTPQEIIDSIDGKPPYFVPGSTCAQCPGLCGTGPNSQCWYYSNTNYILLGRIIEKVTGRPLRKELRDRIFKPLKLNNTTFPTRTTLRGQRSEGYMATEIDGTPVQVDCPTVTSGDLELYDATTCLSPSAAWAAGAIISTLPDLRVWLTALVNGTLLPPDLQAERLIFVPGAIGGPGGIPIQYGLGIMRFDDSFLPFPPPSQSFLGHGGEFQGYASVMMQGETCSSQILDMVNLFPQPSSGDAGYFTLFVAADGILCHNLTCADVLQELQGLESRGLMPKIQGGLWKAFH